MKHYYSFLIITSLLLAGCGQKDRAKFQFESSVQTEESYPLAKEYIKEAVITGKVLNRDFYPQEKELTDRKSTRLNSSHTDSSRMPSSA